MVKEQWIYHGKITMHKTRTLDGRRYIPFANEDATSELR